MRALITIHPDLGRNAWMATFHEDKRVQDLFGTDTLITPFTLLAEGEEARREVERRNPHARVRLIRRDGTVYDPETSEDHPQRERP